MITAPTTAKTTMQMTVANQNVNSIRSISSEADVGSHGIEDGDERREDPHDDAESVMRTIEPLRTAASLPKPAPETAPSIRLCTDPHVRRTLHPPPNEGGTMGLGVSIFLIAVGAILTWAVNATVSGLEIDTIGVILMVVGVARPRALDDLLVVVGRLRRRAVASAGARPTSTTRPRVSERRRRILVASARRGGLTAASRPAVQPSAQRAARTRSVEPAPGSDSTQMRPSIRRTISRRCRGRGRCRRRRG